MSLNLDDWLKPTDEPSVSSNPDNDPGGITNIIKKCDNHFCIYRIPDVIIFDMITLELTLKHFD